MQLLGSGARSLSALCPLRRFWVPEHLVFDFVKSLAAREAALQSAPGFLGLVVTQSSAGVGPDMTVTFQSMVYSSSLPTLPDFASLGCMRRFFR